MCKQKAAHPLMIEVTKGLQASARGFDKTGAGPMATQRMGPSWLGLLSAFACMSRATIVATLPVNQRNGNKIGM